MANTCAICADDFTPARPGQMTCRPCERAEGQSSISNAAAYAHRQRDDSALSSLLDALRYAHRRWPDKRIMQILVDGIEHRYANAGKDEPDIYELAAIQDGDLCEMILAYAADSSVQP